MFLKISLILIWLILPPSIYRSHLSKKKVFQESVSFKLQTLSLGARGFSYETWQLMWRRPPIASNTASVPSC
uniref:Secreted protein n=1 Tax=Setaria viridis TaxID=4556 RepID=A0A4U6UYT6_SETVI|nr:hypothetical protein SEVIR_5G301366v2 [Setaria viridis]